MLAAELRTDAGALRLLQEFLLQREVPEGLAALVALGYKPNEVNKLFGKLDLDGLSAEDIIRQALKQAAA